MAGAKKVEGVGAHSLLVEGSAPGSTAIDGVGEAARAKGTWKLLPVLAVIALVACAAWASEGWRAHKLRIGAASKALRLQENICGAVQLHMDLGSGLVKLHLGQGSGSQKRSCPESSANPEGSVEFECLTTGNWKFKRQTCYACPSLRQMYKYEKGQEREIFLPTASQGLFNEQACVFQDGTSYDRGSILFQCMGDKWTHVNTTCCNHRCLSGTVVLDFYGSMGKVPYTLEEGDGQHTVKCPSYAPKPEGEVVLECGPAPPAPEGKPPRVGEWQMVGHGCQDCSPTSMELTVGGVHKANMILPAAKLNGIEEKPCEFEDGKKYKYGKINFRCEAEGWAFLKSSCYDGTCPPQTAVMKMQYTVGDETMTGTSQIALKASDVGTFEYKCPEGSLDPHGTVTFDCKEDGRWHVNTVSCGAGAQINPSEDHS